MSEGAESAPPRPDPSVTEILRLLGEGDRSDAALGLVYDELRRMAAGHLARERRGVSLSATDLVHEMYVRLAGDLPVAWQTRAHFFGVAAEAMRRILVERARRRRAAKRGGGRRPVTLEADAAAVFDRTDEILSVDEAIRRMEGQDPAAASIVRLRFFAGLSEDETARALGISPRTVRREWSYARAVIFRELSG